MKIIKYLIALFLTTSCLANQLPEKPEEPEIYAMPFECKYKGFVVLRGWLVVPEEKVEQIEDAGIDFREYWLECDSPIYSDLRCGLVREA